MPPATYGVSCNPPPLPLKEMRGKINLCRHAYMGEGQGGMDCRIGPGQTGSLVLGIGWSGIHSPTSHLRPDQPSPWKSIVISRLWSEKTLM
jgi:hypothetical protein